MLIKLNNKLSTKKGKRKLWIDCERMFEQAENNKEKKIVGK
jgi:hypothetical protein